MRFGSTIHHPTLTVFTWIFDKTGILTIYVFDCFSTINHEKEVNLALASCLTGGFMRAPLMKISGRQTFNVSAKPTGRSTIMGNPSTIQQERMRRVSEWVSERRWMCVNLLSERRECENIQPVLVHRCCRKRVMERLQIFQYWYFSKYQYFWQDYFKIYFCIPQKKVTTWEWANDVRTFSLNIGSQ